MVLASTCSAPRRQTVHTVRHMFNARQPIVPPAGARSLAINQCDMTANCCLRAMLVPQMTAADFGDWETLS